MKKYECKLEAGITLVALVITIIVLLILAGVSISFVVGKNGILTQASNSKEITNSKNIEENVKLSVLDAFTNGLGKVNKNELILALNNNLGEGNYRLEEHEENVFIVVVNDTSFKITSNGKVNEENVIDAITNPYLPNEDLFEKVEGTDLNNGLVIKEKSTGSQYVWIEVPKTKKVYGADAINIPTEDFDDLNKAEEVYAKIENALKTYTSEYGKSTPSEDIYNQDDNKNNGWYSDAEYKNLKRTMLKSIYVNGGFWVGRYEAGIENNRTSNQNATTTPLSKEGLYPYTWITRKQAKQLSEQVESGNYKSSLMFGIQWNLMLKYLQEKSVATEQLITTSKNIGNYRDSSFMLNRGKFAKYGALSSWYDYDSTSKSDLVQNKVKLSQTEYEKGILLQTGSTEATKLFNIYDIAGNVWEWTLEKATTGNPIVSRGGSYDCSGTTSVDSKDHTDATWNYSNIGFRVTIY